MSFHLLSTVTPWLVAFAVIAVLGVSLAVGALTEGVLRNRRVRMARHQSVRTYYRGLVLSH